MKYRLYTKSNTVSMILTYGEDDFLERWEVEKPCPPTFWRLLWKHPPLSMSALMEMQEQNGEMFLIEEIPADLSFGVFWDAYGHKVGNKGRAERLWNALSDGERVAALRGVATYQSFLVTRSTMEKAFAETWLNQRRWEN